ncbi:MAG: hypothetical protein V4463_00450 [Pseudomonadota bacterium]
MTPAEHQALDRLIVHACGSSGQSRRVADLLLAWWNADECGRFDPRDMWNCDGAIVDDMLTVLRFVGHHQVYPDKLGYGNQFAALVAAWRPELTEQPIVKQTRQSRRSIHG